VYVKYTIKDFFKKLTYLYIKNKMTEKKSLVEEAIVQMKNLEEAVAENAKGILASTMRQEIKDLVKESLKEQDDEEIEDEEDDMDIEDDEMDMEDASMDLEDDDMDIEDNMDMSEPDMGVDTIDLTNQPTSQVLKVFKLLSPEDEIVVTKDNAGNINLKDNEKEYMIVGEGINEFDENLYEMDDEFENLYELDDEFENLYEDEYDLDETTYGDGGLGMNEEDRFDENLYEMDDESDIESVFEKEFSEGTIYELEIEDDYDYGDMMEMDSEEEFEEDFMMESKKSIKPKGMGLGSASKFKYDSKPNMSGGFKEKMKQGPRSVGTGKVPKDLYKDSPSFDGEFTKKPTKSKEAKEGMMMKPKKVETKEASRTLGNGKYWGREGLPKPKAAPRHIRKESVETEELNLLREKNEEYRKALNIFRNKLNEVAIFNSNLAYATRLFTEHSTSKQEKVNILKRFDGVETLKESKNLYKVIKDELSNTKTQQVNESVERTIQKSPSTGSAINLIESKTYENPQFLRMKDLMSKLK
jgi:hypothetical protein